MPQQMRDWDVIEKEQKLEKKYRRLTKNAVYCLGGGIGLLLIKTFMPDMGVEGARHFMNGLGLTILAYGALMLVAMGFFRAQVFKINFFMMFFVVPAVIIKLLVDTL